MAGTNKLQDNKEIALDFLKLVIVGQIDEAYKKYVDMTGQHHNVYYPAQFKALKQGMIENHSQFPDKQFMVKHVVSEGSIVAVHSNIVLKPADPGIAAVHIFRIDAGRIVEMWDIGQPVPADSPNKAGAF
ncbi:MAG TPA: nuclear transport factor 2 family protein [Anaerolineales bacterium]